MPDGRLGSVGADDVAVGSGALWLAAPPSLRWRRGRVCGLVAVISSTVRGLHPTVEAAAAAGAGGGGGYEGGLGGEVVAAARRGGWLRWFGGGRCVADNTNESHCDGGCEGSAKKQTGQPEQCADRSTRGCWSSRWPPVGSHGRWHPPSRRCPGATEPLTPTAGIRRCTLCLPPPIRLRNLAAGYSPALPCAGAAASWDRDDGKIRVLQAYAVKSRSCESD